MSANGWFLTLLILYFAPALMAVRKKGAAGIVALNLLLGWTVLGWIIALVWALAAPRSLARPLWDSWFYRRWESFQLSDPTPIAASTPGRSPVLLTRVEHAGEIAWRVEARNGPLGMIYYEDAKDLAFRIASQVMPRARFVFGDDLHYFVELE